MEEEEVSMLRSEQEQEIEMPVVSKANHLISMAPQLSCDSVCTFFNKANNASDAEERSKSMKKLCALIVFYLAAMLVEIVGGVKANSLAVMTDAAHLLTDIAGLSISLFTVWASGWEATSHHSFGFNRLEVLGALLSVQLIWLISGFLIYEACQRILQKYAKVDGKLMFGVAAFGFIINLIMAVFLGHDHAHHHGHGHDHHIDHGHGRHHNHHHSHDHDHHSHGHDHHEDDETNLIPSSPVRTKILNINLQGAYLHMLTDLIQSVGVMIAGSIMWKKPHWYVVDLLCTFIFSTFALTTTIRMLRNVFGILMEKTPSEINIDRLRSDLKGIKGVQTVHDLHIWAITVGKIVMSCHVIAEPGISSSEILYKIRDHCQRTHRIHHVTVQIE